MGFRHGVLLNRLFKKIIDAYVNLPYNRMIQFELDGNSNNMTIRCYVVVAQNAEKQLFKVRLNRSLRLFYRQGDGLRNITITVLEINKHEYK